MLNNRPSQTAVIVAYIRAIADGGVTSVRGFSDKTAQQLLPQPWSSLARWVKWRLRNASPQRLRKLSERSDVVTLRTMAIDAELRAALAAGIGQVVILGAGLDGRAYRMSELSQAVVFEVDHPASQRYKRARVVGMPLFARELQYVTVNFESETVGQRLAQTAHRSDLPTVWLWEGVVMYLTDHGLRQTLDTIAERSAPGSVLLVQYSEPNAVSRHSRVWSRVTTLLGEPQIGLRTQATLAAELARVGLQVVRDSSALDWSQKYCAEPLQVDTASTMRLAVATLPSLPSLPSLRDRQKT